MSEVPATQTQVEYYEKQIDQLERDLAELQRATKYQIRRAKIWRDRYYELKGEK